MITILAAFVLLALTFWVMPFIAIAFVANWAAADWLIARGAVSTQLQAILVISLAVAAFLDWKRHQRRGRRGASRAPVR